LPRQEKNFIMHIREHGSSSIYLTGCILYTVCTLGALLIRFSLFNILQIAYVLLSVVGIWLFYSASKNREKSNDFLTGLTLFRTSAIIGFVLFCIIVGFLILGLSAFFIFAMITRETLGTRGLALASMLFAIITSIGLFIIMVKFYFIPLLNVLKSIKDGINNYNITRIKGVNSLIVLSIIGIILAFKMDFFSYMYAKDINIFIDEINLLFYDFTKSENVIPTIKANIFKLILTSSKKIGLLLLLVTLKKFSKLPR
jgi:hypothetical protein